MPRAGRRGEHEGTTAAESNRRAWETSSPGSPDRGVVPLDEQNPSLRLSLHGPGVTVEDAIEAATATKKLLGEVGKAMGVEGVKWEVASIAFQCDDCGLTRPDRPGPDQGWTHRDGDDFCPACSQGGDPQ